MVRADIIDFIDKVLRTYSHNLREPFGGKQLLLVGDVFQLEPVVKSDEREILNRFYPNPYFFSAKVFQEMELVSIELTRYTANRPGIRQRARPYPDQYCRKCGFTTIEHPLCADTALPGRE